MAFSLRVWKEINDLGIMETRRFAAISNMFKRVLMIYQKLKLRHTLTIYDKDLVSIVARSLPLTVKRLRVSLFNIPGKQLEHQNDYLS